MMDLKNNKERFIELLTKALGENASTKLLEFLEESDFYIAPASTKYHGVYEGGLLDHTLNVIETGITLINTFQLQDEIDVNSYIICAAVHDFCKIDFYEKTTKWKKDINGRWESYEGYKIRDDIYKFGHAPASVILASKYINLSDEEIEAILAHMGRYDVSTYYSANDVSSVYRLNKLAYILHAADDAATFLLEEYANV